MLDTTELLSHNQKWVTIVQTLISLQQTLNTWKRYSYRSLGNLKFITYSSLGAQKVKNPAAMQETWVQSLNWEVPLEEEMATYSSILEVGIPGEFHGQRSLVDYSPWGLKRVRLDWATNTNFSQIKFLFRVSWSLNICDVRHTSQRKMLKSLHKKLFSNKWWM